MSDLVEVDLESEILRSQMEGSREALSQKIEMLEDKVAETVQTATDSVAEATSNVLETVQTARESVSETVDSVTNAVQGTVDTVCQSVERSVDNVKGAFDVGRHVKQYPWLVMGGAVAAGFLTARLLESRQQSPNPRGPVSLEAAQPIPREATTNIPFSHPSSIPVANADSSPTNRNLQTPTWLEQISTMFAPEIQKLEHLAVGLILASMRDGVVAATPPTIQGPLSELFDSFTEKLGGQSLPRRPPQSI